jgi:hypothetical protein
MRAMAEARVPLLSRPGSIARFAVLGVLLLAVGIAMQVSRNRSFQVDEIEHLHAAYNIASGRLLYRDFWEGHNPLLYVLLQPLTDRDDPVATLGRARWLFFGVLVMNVLTAAYCAGKLAGLDAAGLCAGLLLLHSTFVERGIEVRQDGALSLCLTVALALELRGGPRGRRYCLQALALSLSFLFTQKAVFGCFAFGCLWLWNAWKHRRPSMVLYPVLTWVLPVAAAVLLLLREGVFDDYLRWNFGTQISLVAGTVAHSVHARTVFSPLPYIQQEGARNRFLLFVGPAGVLHALSGLMRTPGLAFVGFLSAVLVGSLWANPFPFPYLHVGVLPALAIAAAALVVGLVARLGANGSLATGALVVLVCLLVAGERSLPRLIDKTKRSQGLQLEVLREVQRITRPSDAVFDLVGFYFRPDAYPVFLMTGHMVDRYKRGAFPPISTALRASGPAVVMVNYRTAMLPVYDRTFIANHYTHYDLNILVPGTRLAGVGPGENREFDVLREAVFRHDGPGQLFVDGRPFTQGGLTRGTHTLGANERLVGGRLVLDTPPPVPADPRVSPDLFYGFD